MTINLLTMLLSIQYMKPRSVVSRLLRTVSDHLSLLLNLVSFLIIICFEFGGLQLFALACGNASGGRFSWLVLGERGGGGEVASVAHVFYFDWSDFFGLLLGRVGLLLL